MWIVISQYYSTGIATSWQPCSDTSKQIVKCCEWSVLQYAEWRSKRFSCQGRTRNLLPLSAINMNKKAAYSQRRKRGARSGRHDSFINEQQNKLSLFFGKIKFYMLLQCFNECKYLATRWCSSIIGYEEHCTTKSDDCHLGLLVRRLLAIPVKSQNVLGLWGQSIFVSSKTGFPVLSPLFFN